MEPEGSRETESERDHGKDLERQTGRASGGRRGTDRYGEHGRPRGLSAWTGKTLRF